ncbi:MAG: helix-turn-helix transcriptional regulator [Actinomycetota bacterium]|nr:helix-turn-helix transcriptional regulator [Actinomycetota bacterium]
MPSPTETIGQRLRARRVELGLTLAQVAEQAGLSLPYVSNLERGRGNPTLDALSALAQALDVPIGSLMGDDGGGDPLDSVLASAPRSLLQFARSTAFREAVDQLAQRQGASADEMRRRLLVGMASSPRRSSGEPTEDDWRRLLDAYSLILQQ